MPRLTGKPAVGWAYSPRPIAPSQLDESASGDTGDRGECPETAANLEDAAVLSTDLFLDICTAFNKVIWSSLGRSIAGNSMKPVFYYGWLRGTESLGFK